MKKGRYIFVLAILTAFLFGVSQWVSMKRLPPHKQTQKAAVMEQTSKPDANTAKHSKPLNQLRPQARIVTLYPAGSFTVKKTKPKSKPPKKKQVEKPPIKQKVEVKKLEVQPQKKPTPKHKDVPRVSHTFKGDRPTLEVGYGDIGFDRYIDVMERVGRLFVLIDDEGQIKLGPEVSLKRKKRLGERGIDEGRFALDRPHLISDPFIKNLLS